MGRKSKRPDGGAEPEVKEEVFCFFCNRDFDDEKNLIVHQKSKHFRCPSCYKQCPTSVALVVHCQQVHKETLTEVPGALPARNDIKLEIYGMTGVAEAMLAISGEQSRSPKVARIENAYSVSDMSMNAGAGVWGVPGMMPGSSSLPVSIPMGMSGMGFNPMLQPPHYMHGVPPPPQIQIASYGGYQGGVSQVPAPVLRAPSPGQATLGIGAPTPGPPPPPPGAPPAAHHPWVGSAQLAQTAIPSAYIAASSVAMRRGVNNAPAWLQAQQMHESRPGYPVIEQDSQSKVGLAENSTSNNPTETPLTSGAAASGLSEPQDPGLSANVTEYLHRTISGVEMGAGAADFIGSMQEGRASTVPPAAPVSGSAVPMPMHSTAASQHVLETVSVGHVAKKLSFVWADEECSMEERRAQKLGFVH